MTSDPYRTSATGDRTWSQGPLYRVATVAVPVVMVAIFLPIATSVGTDVGTYGWFVLAMFVLVLGAVVVETLRTAHRVTLRRDGRLELVRPIGTVRIRVEQVRAMRVSRFDNQRSQSIRMVTDHGTYRVQRRLDDVGGLADALRERNPRIELPSI